MVLFFRLTIISFKINTPKNDFEKLKFSPFDLQNKLLNNNDPNGNFFLTQISFAEISQIFYFTSYFTIEETILKLSCSDDKTFSTLSEYKKFKEKI